MILKLGSLLNDSVRRAKIEPALEATFAMKEFNQTVRDFWGAAVAKEVAPQYIRRGTLTV
ncbi:hypothetical protein HY224_02240, partial [Candidatus Uhrbacteria bacterium]|nr:hypothetical protein [Candidatus Uhrbacteria bacterium]